MTETTLTSTAGDAGVIADLADVAASREILQLNDRTAGLVLRHDQRLHEIDLDQFGSNPFRMQGAVAVTDAESLVAYVTRHVDERGTTLWSDVDRGRIVAVINDHERHGEAGQGEDLPGWGDHRAVLTLKQTKDWQHWTSNDGKYMEQKTFAEHIEDGIDAINDPAPATMLEIAQTFHAKSGANFISSQQLSGEVEFSFEETVKAKAGQKGTLEVPQRFELALAPFEGCDAYRVQARFRFRLREGQLLLGYRLIRPDRALKTAFDDLVQVVSAGTDLPVMAGVPRS